MLFRLGKQPAVPGAISWRYGDVFNRGKLIQPPLVFGHVNNRTVVDTLGNDKAGCCVWATQAHLLNTMQRGARASVTPFSEMSVLGDYAAQTGWRADDPSSDRGTSMSLAASYWRKTGIADAIGNRHKIDAYVEIQLRNINELMQATFDFDGIALGVQLPKSAYDQYTAGLPWTVAHSSPILGGHAVALLGRNANGDAVIATWDGLTAASMAWIAEYMDEAVGYFSLENLDARGVNPRGYDRTEIAARLSAISKGTSV